VSDDGLVKVINKNRTGMIAFKKRCLEDMYENSRPMKRVELINLQMKANLLQKYKQDSTPTECKNHVGMICGIRV